MVQDPDNPRYEFFLLVMFQDTNSNEYGCDLNIADSGCYRIRKTTILNLEC